MWLQIGTTGRWVLKHISPAGDSQAEPLLAEQAGLHRDCWPLQLLPCQTEQGLSLSSINTLPSITNPSQGCSQSVLHQACVCAFYHTMYCNAHMYKRLWLSPVLRIPRSAGNFVF